MKKLHIFYAQVLFLFAFIILSIPRSLSANYAVVEIWNVSPVSVMAGDSVDIMYKFTPPDVAPFSPNSAIDLIDASTHLTNIWSGPWQTLGLFPRVEYAPGDTVYVMRVKIPDNAAPGLAKVYGSGGNTNFAFTISPRITTGIITHKNDIALIQVRFFSITGDELDKPLYKVVNIKVSYYDDGSIISQQIIPVE